MGRFVSPDPLGYVDGPNTYAFAGNDPTNVSDPLGLWGQSESSLREREALRQKHEAIRENDVLVRKAACAESELSFGCQRGLRQASLAIFGDESPRLIPAREATDGTRSSPIVFVNGVWNTERMAVETANALSEHMGSPVEVLWNPTQGTLSDLLQTTFVNRLGTPDETTKLLVEHLRNRVAEARDGETVRVVAHSQGAAITATALGNLSEAERSKIQLLMLGEAASRVPDGLASVRRVVNIVDYVPLLVNGLAAFLGEGKDVTLFIHSGWHPMSGYLRNEGDLGFGKLTVSGSRSEGGGE